MERRLHRKTPSSWNVGSGVGHTGAYISQMGTKWNLEAKDTDDVYVVIYGKTYIGEGRHVVGHSAFIIGNSEDGYTEVGFGPQDFSPEILPDYGDFGPTFGNTYLQGAITEKYYNSLSDIKQARLFKLNFDRSDTYNLISMINYYQNNSDWIKKPYYEPTNNGNPYWRYNPLTNNCNSFVMNTIYNIVPIDDTRRDGISFFEYNPETQGDNLEKNNQLIVEVCKQ